MTLTVLWIYNKTKEIWLSSIHRFLYQNLNMSNHRGRFPGRPLSARRTKIRQRITESEVCKSNGPNAYETAQQIQRGINVFRKTFMSSNPAFSSQHDSMVSFHFCHYFGGSLRHRLEKRLKVCNGIKINKEKLVNS